MIRTSHNKRVSGYVPSARHSNPRYVRPSDTRKMLGDIFTVLCE